MTLEYRATIVLHCRDDRSGASLMEREFVTADDAIVWCQVMSRGLSLARGAWFVARRERGRTLRIIEASGLGLLGSERAAVHSVAELAPPASEGSAFLQVA